MLDYQYLTGEEPPLYLESELRAIPLSVNIIPLASLFQRT